MAKTLSVYLPTEEAKELETFCSENNCTPYRAVRIGLQMLFKESEAKEEPQSKETPKPEEQKPKPKSGSMMEVWQSLGKK